ncbi:MAG: hypothetical protein ACHQ1D_11090 [Nitrososphaerales archaeon]
MSQSHQRSTRFDLEMRLGESYIEGKALSDDGEYIINIQGGKTCIVLPSEFAEKCENATIHFFTEKGTELKIETEVEHNRDWIEVNYDYLTTALSRDLPTAMTIECNDARI